MRIALAGTSRYDYLDPRSWSGLPFSLREALERHEEVETVLMAPLAPPLRVPEAARKTWSQLRGRRYFWWREPRILRHHTKQLSRLLDAYQPDAVLALGGDTAAAMPEGVHPVLYADGTWKSMVDYYESWSGLDRRSERIGEAAERQAFAKAGHAVFASDWAAQSAIHDYGFPAERISVAPLGGMTTSQSDAAELDATAARRLERPLRLLWVGMEWERKGGQVAIDAARALDESIGPVELHLVGRYPEEVAELSFVRAHGTLDPVADRALLDELFAMAFVLILPSRAEAAGNVFAEAASYAVPSLAGRTGGVPTMVHEGVNGMLFAVDADGAAYAAAVQALRAEPVRYLALCRSSRQRFEKELNWDGTAAAVVAAARTIIGESSGASRS